MTWGDRRPVSPRRRFAPLARTWEGSTKRRRVPFQLGVDQPEVAVAAMQGFRMLLVTEPDRFDDVFQRETDEADFAVLGLAQVRLIGLGGVLGVMVQSRRDRDGMGLVVYPVVATGPLDGDRLVRVGATVTRWPSS